MKKQNKIEKEVIFWNNRFPLDRWWREKHSVPFMSLVHRESSFLDQLFEFTEDNLIEEMREGREEYKPNTGDFLQNNSNKSKMELAREEFENEFL